LNGLAALDYAMLALVLVSCLIGLLRGLFREAMSLAVWVGAAWVAARYGDWLSPRLAEFVANTQLRLWAARIGLLITILIGGGILSWLLAKILRSTGLGGADRFAGMVFGLARGMLLASLAIIVLKAAGFDDQPWWRQSKLIPYVAPVADTLREAAEQGLRRSWSLSLLP
jgi:membrane protein required for colicin V production